MSRQHDYCIAHASHTAQALEIVFVSPGSLHRYTEHQIFWKLQPEPRNTSLLNDIFLALFQLNQKSIQLLRGYRVKRSQTDICFLVLDFRLWKCNVALILQYRWVVHQWHNFRLTAVKRVVCRYRGIWTAVVVSHQFVIIPNLS